MTLQSRFVPFSLRELHGPSMYDPIGLLESTRERLLSGDDVAQVVENLSDGLWWMRYSLPPEDWREIMSIARAHPLTGLLHEDPLIRRAFVKPRGYAGDAPLIDLIYQGASAAEVEGISPLGLALLDCNTRSPSAVAVRECRHFVADLIDHVAEIRPAPAILSAGCGHLREGLISQAVQQRRIGRLVALDQDADSLEVVAREFGPKGVESVNRNVKAVIDGIFPPSSFDMIYAVGLYDYLLEHFAKRLTRAFFDLLKPGGRLVIANAVHHVYDAAYIEVFGDWFMVSRSATDMMDLAGFIGSGEVVMKRVYTRLSPDIFYLEVRKRLAVPP
jgi:extracellular factor (EF) 3-hydroxypalmitic acid methyl ester biosynthesis protein